MTATAARQAAEAAVIVVLGAALRAPGTPGPAMQRRVVEAVRLWQQTPEAWLILSGGQVGPPPAEAVVMRDLLAAAGVPQGRMILEDRSRNTFENALYTGTILRDRGWPRVVVVSDAYHLPRALLIFRRLGIAACGHGVRRPAGVPRRRWYAAWLREGVACGRSAWLFAIGRHKPLVAREWGG